MRAIFLITKNKPPILKSKKFSDTFKSFIAACLVKDPLKRPTAKQLLSHPFIVDAGKNKILATKINNIFNNKSIRVKPRRMRSNDGSTSLESLIDIGNTNFDVSYNKVDNGTVIITNDVTTLTLEGYESLNMAKKTIKTKKKRLVPKVLTNLLSKSKGSSSDSSDQKSSVKSGKTDLSLTQSKSSPPLKFVLNLPINSSDPSLRVSIANGQKSDPIKVKSSPSSPAPRLIMNPMSINKLPMLSLANPQLNLRPNNQDQKCYFNDQELDRSIVKYENTEKKLFFSIKLKNFNKTTPLPWILQFPGNLNMDSFDDVIDGKFQVTIKSQNTKNLDCLGFCSWKENKIIILEVKIFEGMTSQPKTILPNTLPDDIVIKYSRKRRS